mmetsp:Transcript_41530/g.36882  ORF Transcript_41530/g.36882 Transcript_41530/m.36882 type:complete len:114 (-) Transcript_41530:430-771(-)
MKADSPANKLLLEQSSASINFDSYRQEQTLTNLSHEPSPLKRDTNPFQFNKASSLEGSAAAHHKDINLDLNTNKDSSSDDKREAGDSKEFKEFSIFKKNTPKLDTINLDIEDS